MTWLSHAAAYLCICAAYDKRARYPGTRGQNWYGEKRVSFIRSKVRTQNAWLLHLAGDFHGRFETKQVLHRPHHMRVMLTSNLAVDQRFANGTRLVVRVLLFVWVGHGHKNQTRHIDERQRRRE